MEELHEREVVRRTRVSKGSANKILRRLSEIGVLEREKRGRMVFYRLDMKNALARQFKVLFNVYSLNELVEEIKQDCERIMLFGSCSDGTDVKESDVDLFVLANEKDKVKSKIGAYRKMRRRIAPIVVNSKEFVKLRRGDKRARNLL